MVTEGRSAVAWERSRQEWQSTKGPEETLGEVEVFTSQAYKHVKRDQCVPATCTLSYFMKTRKTVSNLIREMLLFLHFFTIYMHTIYNSYLNHLNSITLNYILSSVSQETRELGTGSWIICKEKLI